jgi:hypothetical protein
MIIIVLMLFVVYVDYDLEEMSSTFGFGNLLTWLLVRSLCFVQFGLTLFYCALWFKMKSNLALKKFDKE